MTDKHLEEQVALRHKLELRQSALKILLHKFGHEGNNRAIYECADEWVEKQVTSSGIVDYYNAYKKSFINKSLTQE